MIIEIKGVKRGTQPHKANKQEGKQHTNSKQTHKQQSRNKLRNENKHYYIR